LCVRLAQAAEPARGFHALFKCCEAAICAARPTTVNRAPRIVLSLGWSIEHSRRSDNTEHKQDKSHQSPSQSGIADGSTIKIWARRFFDLSQNRSLVWPHAASRRRGPRSTFCDAGHIPNADHKGKNKKVGPRLDGHPIPRHPWPPRPRSLTFEATDCTNPERVSELGVLFLWRGWPYSPSIIIAAHAQ
jgi:hypothetical protein